MHEFQDLIEKLPALVAYIDASGVYRRMSGAYEKWCGIRREEWLGRHFPDVATSLFGKAYAREALPRLRRALQGEVISFESNQINCSGCRRAAVSYTPDRDNFGKVKGVLVLVTDLTSLRKAEDRAAASEQRLQLSTEFGNMGAWDWDLASGKLVWNAASFRVFGYGEHESPPHFDELLERIHPEDRVMQLEVIEEARRNRAPFDLKYRVRGSGGEWSWIRSRGRFLLGEDGEPVRALGVSLDVTREKLASERMDKQKQLIESILDSTTDGVLMLDPEWRITYLNSRAKTVVRRGDDILGCNLWEAFPHALASKFGELYARSIQERVPVHFEEFYPEPLNRWFEVHAYPSDTGMALFFRDVTRRRKGMERLRLQEQAIAAVPVGICMAEFDAAKDFPLVYVNPGFEQLTGYSADEVLGKNCRFLQGPGTRTAVRTEIRKAVESGTPVKMVIRNYRKDGTNFLNELHITPVRNEEGKITHLVGVQADVTELMAARKRLTRQAQIDSLTGVSNRQHFLDRLKDAVRTSHSPEGGVAVIYLDVDNLKHVNERLGHHGGDRLLRKVALRIRSSVRESDLVGRLGGDEFAILVTGPMDQLELESMIERVLAKICSPIRVGGRELVTTASAGYVFASEDATDAEELLRKADVAMYAAKRDCKNTWKVYKRSMDVSNEKFIDVVSDLRQALKGQEFRLYYQPRIDARTGELHAFEALIRWQHPERGLLPPTQFIPIAEEAGLIVQIGQWVVEEAVRQIQAWRAAGFNPLRISVNVSAAQFRDPGFADAVARTLGRAEISGRLLEMEVTESVLMDETVSAEALASLRRIGIRIAIDDFGTAYSGLNYLQRFQIDVLKIDRNFITSIHQNPTAATICHSILQLAQRLGLTTVAEGVELAEQAQLLKEWGCDELQGHHFGPPIPAEQIQAMMFGFPTPG